VVLGPDYIALSFQAKYENSNNSPFVIYWDILWAQELLAVLSARDENVFLYWKLLILWIKKGFKLNLILNLLGDLEALANQFRDVELVCLLWLVPYDLILKVHLFQAVVNVFSLKPFGINVGQLHVFFLLQDEVLNLIAKGYCILARIFDSLSWLFKLLSLHLFEKHAFCLLPLLLWYL